MDLKEAIGFDPVTCSNLVPGKSLLEYAKLKLLSIDQPIHDTADDHELIHLTRPLLQSLQEKTRLLGEQISPVDTRLQEFINSYLADVADTGGCRLPARTLILDRHGLARTLSVPANADHFQSSIIDSYRVHQGVLHNPTNDRRTTAGVFHVAEGGYPIPGDKLAIPKPVFARLLQVAVNPPESLLALPFTALLEHQAKCWVSLYLRPLVVPEIPGRTPFRHMEIRFFAPGSMICNLDFVESIFGNAGDPWLPDNDSALDPQSWTGHSGCVILAPHLVHLTKKDLGLPHCDEADDDLRSRGLCWKKESDRYNEGKPFKITARGAPGRIVTIIADNYFGYCKKEVKTQISFSANLFGRAEEEHSGGAIAFPSYDLGEDFRLSSYQPEVDHTFAEAVAALGDNINLQPEGWAIDRNYPDICYVPEDAYFSLNDQTVSWQDNGGRHSIRLQPEITYVLPSGYKVRMIQPHEGRRWRLVGTTAEGTFCHKPCTVSGGGKSEISKSISDAIITGPVIVADYKRDFDAVADIIGRNYGDRFRDPARNKRDSRSLLSSDRSLGSVIKLLTSSPEYTDAYNEWLRSIPYYIKELVFVIKRYYRSDWGDDWKSRFKVDLVNGTGGNELKFRDNRMITHYLRVGFTEDGSWRTFGLRKDFFPAVKLQMADDITASTVVPRDWISGLNPLYPERSVKFIENCEFRLFQRPDDAIIRGYDKNAERDIARDGNFFCNFQPLDRGEVARMRQDSIRFHQFTDPVKDRLVRFLADDRPDFVVCSAIPRLVDGTPSKNPRYLQNRQSLEDPREFYLAKTGMRLFRRLGKADPVPMPVNATLPGRRNNPPQDGVRPLAVFNPIHWLPLPELFMEFICSMTGRSPSTTGAGSEGALTKGPFNSLPSIIDLNHALSAYLLTEAHAFITAAGWVGPQFRVDHDISLLIPELWSRMRIAERDPGFLVNNGYLEKLDDFEFDGEKVPASLLGYRVTRRFVVTFFGRIFANPDAVFTEEMLRPELQDPACFAAGMKNITDTHRYISEHYFADGSIDMASPPLRALLHIMRDGHWQGKTLRDPEVRSLFDRDTFIESDWYKSCIATAVDREKNVLQLGIAAIDRFLGHPSHEATARRLGLNERRAAAAARLAELDNPDSAEKLRGTIGCDPALAIH